MDSASLGTIIMIRNSSNLNLVQEIQKEITKIHMIFISIVIALIDLEMFILMLEREILSVLVLSIKTILPVGWIRNHLQQ